MASETIVIELALAALSKWRWLRLFFRRSHERITAIARSGAPSVTRKGKDQSVRDTIWERAITA